MKHLSILFRLLRVNQWTKNGVVFAAFFFALGDLNQDLSLWLFWKVALAALVFALVSSGVYILNDIRDAYAQSRVFIAPMRIGTGLQNKLLEAMSMGIPAITTPLANASLGAKPNEEILVGSNAEELARHIITLLTGTAKAEQIAHSGFDFTNRVYDWGKATEILESARVSTLNSKL